MLDKMEEWTVNTLQRLCDEHSEETTTLEFKSCDELRIGSSFFDNKIKQSRERTRDDVMLELSKDVTALLNAAGGTLIYGILEKDSRADKIDRDKAYKRGRSEDDVDPERVQNWLRSHVLPPPQVEVLRVFENQVDANSPWYLVLEVPQGATAYQALDRRFYRRYGATVKPMEQYEVVEVMNRGSVPEADVEFGFRPLETNPEKHVYLLTAKVRNLSSKVIANYKLQFTFPNYKEGRIHQRRANRQDQNGDYIVEYRSQQQLFPEDERDITEEVWLDYTIDREVYLILTGTLPTRHRDFALLWKLYADDMPPKSGKIPFSELHQF